MSDKKKPGYKPPVPARPKNLVVLNSKHLPKPPETFSSDVTNFIKDLNLDIKDEGKLKKIKQSGQYENALSDNEEDAYGYLEPESLSSGSDISKNTNGQLSYRRLSSEDNKGSDVKKSFSRNSSVVSMARPIGANLGRRLSNEMADFGYNLKRRMRKPAKNQTEPDRSYLEVIPEVQEEEPKPSQFQWQRPLPSLPLPPSETNTDVTSMPWYKNVDRKKGEEILKNGIDGCFLVRPSSNPDTYLTLTLWYNKRLYNIPIRKRKDGKFALGTPKTHEQCFDTIEYMIKNYQSEKLVLFSHGVQTGKILLTTYPP